MSRYYDPADKIIQDGTIADAPDVNNVNSSTSAGFDLVQLEIDDIISGESAWAQTAKGWASSPNQMAPGVESAKTYAEMLKTDADFVRASMPTVDQSILDAAESKKSRDQAKISEDVAVASEANAAVAQSITSNCAEAAYQSKLDTEQLVEDARQIIATGMRVEAITVDELVATAGQTDFLSTDPVSVAHPDSIMVFLDKEKLRYLDDYVLTARGIVLTNPAVGGEQVDLVNFNLFDLDEARKATADAQAAAAEALDSETKAATSVQASKGWEELAREWASNPHSTPISNAPGQFSAQHWAEEAKGHAIQGPQGIQGIPGPTGPKGDKGDIGLTGPQGIQGIAGPQGARGLQGDRGFIGLTGQKGDRGIQGLTGSRGPRGYTGPIGPIGLTGPVGPKGDKGDKGDIGNRGLQGVAGPQGLLGPEGPTGPTGPQGPVGTSVVIKGHDNYANILAKQGASGDIWISNNDDAASGTLLGDGLISDGTTGAGQWSNVGAMQGVQGPLGPTGATGPQGQQGPIGLTGPQGVKGDQGIQGIQGEKGDKGDQGDKGDKGDQGDPGISPSNKGADTAANILANTGATLGDTWISTTDDPGNGIAIGDGLTWDGAAWLNVGQLRGPAGADGVDGKDGGVQAFDAAATYAKDDVILGPSGGLYQAKAAVAAGAFDPTQWLKIGATPGGKAGDILTKNSTTDGDYTWQEPAKIPGGADGDVLTKDGAVDGVYVWKEPAKIPGGNDGEILTKDGAVDGVYAWKEPAKISGGNDGEILTKDGATDGVYAWKKPSGIQAFDATSDYAADDLVTEWGNIWRANTPVTAGAFSPPQWDMIGNIPGGSDGEVLTKTGAIDGVYDWRGLPKNINWKILTSGAPIKPGDGIFADTSAGGFSILLPPGAVMGDEIWFVDLTGSFDVNKLTINGMMEKIMGLAESMDVTTKFACVRLTYSDKANGWRITN